MTGQPVATVQQMIYLDGENKDSSNEQAVAIRMYAKLKATAIPTASFNMNVLPAGGPNRTETILSMFQAQ